jgi:NAD(P)-dependent dehydrogenase (short-subunit alcohol dehydrogenase family)
MCRRRRLAEHVGVAAYACTKAAGERLVEVAALEYASRGIRVNTLQPGMLDTSMSRAALEKTGRARRVRARERRSGRLATVVEVAAAASLARQRRVLHDR